jgi:hypothetical protein
MSFCINYFSSLPSLDLSVRSDEELACIGMKKNGQNLSLDEWRDYFINVKGDHTDCTTIFERIINSSPGHTYNRKGFEQVMEDFNFAFASYFLTDNWNNGKGGHTFSTPGQKEYTDMQSILISACSNNPEYHLQGACQNVSEYMCKSCDVENVTGNTDLLKLCGCSVSSLKNSQIYGTVPLACDPLCSHEQVSKKRDVITGDVEECNATVCVVNNVNINVTESTIGGTNFTQVCPQCTSSGDVCKCIIDATIPTITDKVGITSSFRQYCPNAICLQVDNLTGKETVVDCDNAISSLTPKTYNFPIPTWVWIVVLFILLIFILIIYSAHSGASSNGVDSKNGK